MSVVYGTTANVAGAAIQNFQIGMSLSNRIGTSNSNLEASQVPMLYVILIMHCYSSLHSAKILNSYVTICMKMWLKWINHESTCKTRGLRSWQWTDQHWSCQHQEVRRSRVLVLEDCSWSAVQPGTQRLASSACPSHSGRHQGPSYNEQPQTLLINTFTPSFRQQTLEVVYFCHQSRTVKLKHSF